jgi:hypothetical protein
LTYFYFFQDLSKAAVVAINDFLQFMKYGGDRNVIIQAYLRSKAE